MIEFSRAAALLLSAGLGLAAGCRPGNGAGAGDRSEPSLTLSADDKARIRAADLAFSASATAGDADGVAAVYAPDGSLLAPNLPPQKGRDAIRSFWKGFFDAYAVKFEVVSDTIEGRGNLAYSMGHYRFSAVPKAKGASDVSDEGKFLAIFKKQPDGDWKLVVDMYSSNLALQH